MPYYEYRCSECQWSGEQFAYVEHRDNAVCQACGKPLVRILHPIPTHFLGSGWYVTDSRSGSDKNDS